MKTLLLLFLLLIPAGLKAETLHITLEHAVTKEQLKQGLMGYTALPPDHGMIFTYPSPQRVTIWMYNVLIDLSVAFLDKDKVIREIHELKAYPEESLPSFFSAHSVSSLFDASYAIEMNKGWFEKHGVQPGDRITWERDAVDGYIIYN